MGHSGVTLDLLWQEYRECHPDGYPYRGFCAHYRTFARALPATLRQSHAPGERLFVDDSGQTVMIIDVDTGEERQAQIFVAVLGASRYTDVEATWTQGLGDWIGSQVRCLEYLGGAPQILVPDNLKSGVTHPCDYDPDINPSYQEFASHYGRVVLPARVRKPRDKAKAEAGVLLAQRWILARLRHPRFFSLAEINTAIRPLRVALNAHPFKQLPGSRQSVFAALDHPALRPLPLIRYEFAPWQVATVGIDDHVEFDRHSDSVPYRYARQQVEVRATATRVAVFQKGERMAGHPRNCLKGRHTTLEAHLAPAHQAVAGWNAQRFLDGAATVGPQTQAAIEQVLAARVHPQPGYRTALGILRLGKTPGEERLEAACLRAIQIKVVTSRSIASILKQARERQTPTQVQAHLLPDHAQVRGSQYSH